MSTFGSVFRVTTFGESHCKGVGCIIDGVPSRLALTEADIQPQLTRRRPGQSVLTTPRDEADKVKILSGTERGHTLGTPVALMVENLNVRPKDYAEMSKVPRPGHADYTYQVKYGVRATSGGGRSSARETIGRVAAGAVAEKWMREQYGTEIVSFVASIGDVELPVEGRQRADGSPWSRKDVDTLGTIRILRDPSIWHQITAAEEPDEEKRKAAQTALDAKAEAAFVAAALLEKGASNIKPGGDQPAYEDAEGIVYNRNGEKMTVEKESLEAMRSVIVVPVRCPHAPTACKMASLIRVVKSEHDSIGGTVIGHVSGMPIGLGEPCFDKLEAKLAHAMLSLPATKAFETGSGFAGARQRGSAHNDAFVPLESGGSQEGVVKLATKTNNAGGTLGGITNGGDLHFRVAVKPVSTIGQAQETSTYGGASTVLEAKGRHDPCVLPRTPPLVESMTALVVMDAALIQKTRENQGIVNPAEGMFQVGQDPGASSIDEPAAKRARQ